MSYYAARAGLAYYAVVRQLLERIPEEDRGTLLDVGCADTPVATWGEFQRRMTVDLRTNPQLAGVESFVADFLEWELPEPADVVTCLQTLEHLPDGDVERFGAKLRAAGTWLIVSVPYLWPPEWHEHHRQDPIGLVKFFGFVGGHDGLVHIEFVRERGLTRLVAAFGPGPLL